MKQRVALLFGGRSAEHDVSLLSARNIYEAIDRNLYDVSLIGITRDGRWWLQEKGEFPESIACEHQVAMIPGGAGELVVWGKDATSQRSQIDLVMPILHGPFGEDGTVQGALVTAGVPFVGSGVLASAVCMDKDITKRLLREAGIPVVDWLPMRRGEQRSYADVSATLGSDVLFVKPARMGSSIGVGRARSKESFEAATAAALAHDDRIIIEPFVDAREIECAVLETSSQGSKLVTSWPGEIAAATHHEFYTYEAKYLDETGATLRTRADLDSDVAERIRDLAGTAFRTLNCRGLARVDFFLTKQGQIMINEINTFPGFTRISMYPRMMIDSQMTYADLITTLIEEARPTSVSSPTDGL